MSSRQWLNIIFVIFILFISPVHAETDDDRHFDQEKLESFRQNPEFNYEQDYAPVDSIFSIIMAYILNWFASIFNSSGMEWLGPWLFRIFIFLGIVGAIIAIIKLKYSHAFGRSSRAFDNIAVGHFGSEKEDYQKLLQESIDNKEYKLAIRYLFLNSLVYLDQQNAISITKWKAPFEYLKELPTDKKQPFQQLVELFENTWYGDHVAGEEDFEEGMRKYKELQYG